MINVDPKTCRPPNLLGIQVVYCDGPKKKRVWVDLDKVTAISWCNTGSEKGGEEGVDGDKPKMPKTHDPGPCPPITGDGGAPTGGTDMCWWTGSKWECGEAEE